MDTSESDSGCDQIPGGPWCLCAGFLFFFGVAFTLGGAGAVLDGSYGTDSSPNGTFTNSTSPSEGSIANGTDWPHGVLNGTFTNSTSSAEGEGNPMIDRIAGSVCVILGIGLCVCGGCVCRRRVKLFKKKREFPGAVMSVPTVQEAPLMMTNLPVQNVTPSQHQPHPSGYPSPQASSEGQAQYPMGAGPPPAVYPPPPPYEPPPYAPPPYGPSPPNYYPLPGPSPDAAYPPGAHAANKLPPVLQARPGEGLDPSAPMEEAPALPEKKPNP